MKHYTSEEWVDYVRNVQEPGMATRMKAHLEQCDECRTDFRMWTAVTAAASKELTYTPPSHAARIARAQFVAVEPAGSLLDRFAKLVFDSAQHPLPVGVRGSASVCRQLLYQYGQRFIDLRVEKEPANKEVNLVGQIQESTARNTAISVDLYCKEELIQHTETNPQGEFHMAFSPAEDLHLEIEVNDKKFRVRIPEVTETKD